MPLWRIFHPANLYTDAEKGDFADAITKLYKVLPDFYVVVVFTAVDNSTCFVAGKPRGDFVRIKIDQIARTFDPADMARKEWWMSRVEETIAPWVKGKEGKVSGWEVSIDETSRDLWRMDGLSPPQPNSEGEMLWKKEGKPVPYEKS